MSFNMAPLSLQIQINIEDFIGILMKEPTHVLWKIMWKSRFSNLFLL